MGHLRKRGAYVRKNWGSPLSGAGVPDLFACYRGRFVSFELKHPHDVPVDGVARSNDVYAEPAQRQHLRQIREANGVAYVVNSLVQIDLVLDRIDQEG